MATETYSADLTDLTAEVVSAYVKSNSLPAAELPGLLQSVYTTLGQLGTASPPMESKELTPAVPIKKSITDDHLFCLEDGLKFKSLKRHLATSHAMTPQEYRAKWGLPKDYPMAAADYVKSRSALAKKLGLGRKPFR